MKTLSYIFALGAAASFLLAAIVKFLLDGKLIFRHYTYLQGTELCLFAAILFALYHLISAKGK